MVDGANILSDATKADLTEKLAALEQKTSRQLVVVTLPSLQGYEISDYGYQLGRAWGIGQAKLNNGALLIVAPTEHKVRIEVGYGLEPILTDALSEIIIQNAVLPSFRNGDYNGGTEAGVTAIIQQLSLDTSTAEAKAAAAEQQAQQGGNGGGQLSLRRPDRLHLHRLRAAARLWRLGPAALPVHGRRLDGRRRLWRRRFWRRIWRRRRLFWRRRRLGRLVMLTEADHQSIAQAITAAESKTSGEVFCVMAHEVSRYREVPLLWATLAAFVLPPLLALAGLHRLVLDSSFSSWTDQSLHLRCPA